MLINGLREILPGVGLQRVGVGRVADAEVWQAVGLRGCGGGEDAAQPLFHHGPQRLARLPGVPLCADKQFVVYVDGGLHDPYYPYHTVWSTHHSMTALRPLYFPAVAGGIPTPCAATGLRVNPKDLIRLIPA